ncbi:MAG: hypothetical protein Q3961_01970 [Bifidobacteriaceae bacterium]|nr:hypothetical protein [Bifidobacteriaceae bacterium]
MKVTQLKDIVNSATSEVLGKTDVVNDDLSNLVDVGNEIFNSDNVDNYVKKLIDRIGQVIFVNRLYAGGVPSVLMDSWEYGSVVEKISADMPEADENDSWNLQDGQTYSQDTFYQPKVSAKFFNSKVTFDVKLSFTTEQVKESFSNVNELNGFISMLETGVKNSMTVKLDGLIMRTINNMTGQILNSANGLQKVNLLTEYNAVSGQTLTANKALMDKDFLKFASLTIKKYQARITKMSTLFNAGGKARFTTTDNLHTVLLSDFADSAEVYLLSDTYHNDTVSLPNHETVPYWQGSGKSYAFDDISKIDVKIDAGNKTPKQVTQTGILGVMFDTNALGVSNLNQRTTTSYNARAEFYTNYYKMDAGYFNDLNENFVVFYIADQAK